jgi:hypothetical protein
MFKSIPLKLPGFWAETKIARVKKNVEIKSFIIIGFKLMTEKKAHVKLSFLCAL